MIANNTNKIDMLPEFMRNAINSEITKVTEEEIENAKKRIDERRDQIITGVILNVHKAMSVETLGNILQIQVRVIN